MELVVALTIAVPIALVVTWIAMRVTARANHAAERWEHFCEMKK